MLSAKNWRAEAVLHFCAVLLGSIFFGAALSSFLSRQGVSGFRHEEDLGPMFVRTFFFQGTAWPLIYWFLHRQQTTWRGALGWLNPKLSGDLRLALIVVAVALPAVWLLQASSVAILTWFGHAPDTQAAVKLLTSARSWPARLYLAAFAVILAPLAEEFLFRGLLYPFIKQLGWPRLALCGVSFLFALIHFDAATFIPLFVLALVLTWLYEKTDNLLAPITVHALFNAANLALLALQHFNSVPARP